MTSVHAHTLMHARMRQRDMSLIGNAYVVAILTRQYDSRIAECTKHQLVDSLLRIASPSPHHHHVFHHVHHGRIK